MFRKSLLMLTLLLSLAIIHVGAQENADPVGIDTLCGESALTINALDSLPEDANTQALDTLLRQFVTLPSEESGFLSRYSPKPPAPGVVFFVDSPQGTYFRGIGVGDVETCAPLDPKTPFPIGSNTKMFTAAVIYQLHEEGLLSTSDLVSKYVPDEIALWDGTETITIDMLLGHTSGLPDYLNSSNPASVGARITAGEPGVLEMAFTPQELVTAASGDPLLFAPGEEGNWSYSNTGYIMLGQIIEQVTGKSYIEAVTERVIEPLGLQNTALVADIVPAELGLVTQYLISPFTRITSNWSFSQAWSAGNAVSTPEDMAVFLRAYYTGKLYQDPETLAAMTTRAAANYSSESDNLYYMHGGYYKSGFYGHGGQTLGTVSDVGYNPDADTVIVTWANSSESYTGQGVFYVGHALGLTPTLDEVFAELPAMQVSGVSEIKDLAIQDVIGTTFNSLGVYIASSQETKNGTEGSTYSVTFNSDSEMTIVADCNTVMATYTAGEADAIHIEMGASTLVACPEGSIADDFLMVLSAATTVKALDTGEQILVSFTTDDQSTVYFTK